MTVWSGARAGSPGELRRVTHFAIADIPFALETPQGLAALGLSRRYTPFLCLEAPRPPVTHIHWSEGNPSAVPCGETLFDPGDLWRLARRGDGRAGYCATVRYPDTGEGAAQAAVSANEDWSAVEVVERRAEAGRGSLLDVGVGELILRMRALFCDGIIFHASGVEDQGRGLLFVGHSGAGKSTQARIWTHAGGAARLGDDRVIVRLVGSRAIAHAMPWGRPARTRRAWRVPLSALLLVEQAPRNQLVKVSVSEAAPLLLPRAYLPYGDDRLLSRAFSTLEGILALVPVYRLRCRPEPAVIHLVRDGLCESATKS